MTKLSVNINKIATLRNARGGNNPDVEQAAVDCQLFGAQGITVHPRPDERHIRYQDVREIKPLITTEFNIEGNPIDRYIDLVLEVMPTQVTLVPDGDAQLTSNHGWNTIKNKAFLTDVIGRFKEAGIRTSIFVDPSAEMVRGAKECGTDRVELYTESYASGYARPQPGEPCLLPQDDSMDRRGEHRTRHHLRRPLHRTEEHYRGVSPVPKVRPQS